jgi:hypothetical protein
MQATGPTADGFHALANAIAQLGPHSFMGNTEIELNDKIGQIHPVYTRWENEFPTAADKITLLEQLATSFEMRIKDLTQHTFETHDPTQIQVLTAIGAHLAEINPTCATKYDLTIIKDMILQNKIDLTQLQSKDFNWLQDHIRQSIRPIAWPDIEATNADTLINEITRYADYIYLKQEREDQINPIIQQIPIAECPEDIMQIASAISVSKVSAKDNELYSKLLTTLEKTYPEFNDTYNTPGGGDITHTLEIIASNRYDVQIRTTLVNKIIQSITTAQTADDINEIANGIWELQLSPAQCKRIRSMLVDNIPGFEIQLGDGHTTEEIAVALFEIAGGIQNPE